SLQFNLIVESTACICPDTFASLLPTRLWEARRHGPRPHHPRSSPSGFLPPTPCLIITNISCLSQLVIRISNSPSNPAFCTF
ncbi:unnamed protein product, partial [Linum tenue]